MCQHCRLSFDYRVGSLVVDELQYPLMAIVGAQTKISIALAVERARAAGYAIELQRDGLRLAGIDLRRLTAQRKQPVNFHAISTRYGVFNTSAIGSAARGTSFR